MDPHGRKARNVAHSGRVGVRIPVRRLPDGPPYTLHFQGVAELGDLDDPDVVRRHEAGRLGTISGHGVMEMDGACFVRVTPTGTVDA